jgi:hypothetical protein
MSVTIAPPLFCSSSRTVEVLQLRLSDVAAVLRKTSYPIEEKPCQEK